jgi:hypothetical protein
MDHDKKVDLVIAELAARGISKAAIAPPLFRLAWKLGIPIPPPHFLSFGALAVVMGTFFGVLWGIFMWLVFWSDQGLGSVAALIASLAAGALFGIAMAFYYRWKARQLGLPGWHDYGKTGQQGARANAGICHAACVLKKWRSETAEC